jgi:predicted transcriptional regulator
MAASTTITIRVTAEVKERLARLAHDTRRSRSFLAAEAVAGYVEREQAIIDGVKRGLADIAAGLLVPHDEAMTELSAAIEAAGPDRRV